MTLVGISPALSSEVVGRAGEVSQFVESLCARGEVPLPTLARLLESDDPKAAVAAVVGEWRRPGHEVRAEVSDEWRRAITGLRDPDLRELRHTASLEFGVEEVLRKTPELALEWLAAYLPEMEPVFLDLDGPLAGAIDGLDRDRRIELLRGLQPGFAAACVIPRLVGRDDAIYGELLVLPALREHHLAPLVGLPDEGWVQMAERALRMGYTSPEVAGAAFASGYAGVTLEGEASQWEKYREAFAGMESHPDLIEVSRVGRELAERRRAEAVRGMRELEVRGY